MIEEEIGGDRRRRSAQEDDWDFSEFDSEQLSEKVDMSVSQYPEPYCAKVTILPSFWSIFSELHF